MTANGYIICATCRRTLQVRRSRPSEAAYVYLRCDLCQTDAARYACEGRSNMIIDTLEPVGNGFTRSA